LAGEIFFLLDQKVIIVVLIFKDVLPEPLELTGILLLLLRKQVMINFYFVQISVSLVRGVLFFILNLSSSVAKGPSELLPGVLLP